MELHHFAIGILVLGTLYQILCLLDGMANKYIQWDWPSAILIFSLSANTLMLGFCIYLTLPDSVPRNKGAALGAAAAMMGMGVMGLFFTGIGWFAGKCITSKGRESLTYDPSEE